MAGQWRRAVRAWHQLEQQNERGPRPSLKTMEMVLDACAHGQCWEDATAAMAALARHGHSPSLACYQSLLAICAKVRPWAAPISNNSMCHTPTALST